MRWGLAGIGALAVVLYAVFVSSPQDPDGDREPIDFPFEDAEGSIVRLSDFRGRTILLNLWATWCAPCRTEMPLLDQLQARLGGPDFELVAVALERGGTPAAQTFLAETGVLNLTAYAADPSRIMGDLGIVGLPTTLLVDANGHEVLRVVGPAEWDSDEMVARIEQQIATTAARDASP